MLAVVVVVLVYLFCCRDKSKGESSLFIILYRLAPSALAVSELILETFVVIMVSRVRSLPRIVCESSGQTGASVSVSSSKYLQGILGQSKWRY